MPVGTLVLGMHYVGTDASPYHSGAVPKLHTLGAKGEMLL